MSRVSEFLAGWTARDAILFTGTRRRSPGVKVRGVQMAEELGGECLRCRYLRKSSVGSSQALIWIGEPNLELVRRFQGLTPQISEPINPRVDPSGEFNRMTRAFDFLLLNTESSINWLGQPPEKGWKHWVIPHHHCNRSGYQLPDDRLSQPKVVGYLGEPEHLHDADEIQKAIEKLGMRFLNAHTNDLEAYKKMDIGIAWTRRESLRDQTRSNIKLANFCAHGIPSVVCDYESYRDVDRTLGGESCLIRGSLGEFIEGIAELVESEEKRRTINRNALPAREIYSRSEIAKQYRRLMDEANDGFQRNSANERV